MLYFSRSSTGSDSYCRGAEHAAADVEEDLSSARTRIGVVKVCRGSIRIVAVWVPGHTKTRGGPCLLDGVDFVVSPLA